MARFDGDQADSVIWWLGHGTAKLLTPILLILGVQCWLLLGAGNYGHRHQPLLLLAAIAAGLIPPVRTSFERLWNAARRPSLPTRLAIALGLAAGSVLFLFQTLRYQGIPFHPIFQDEFSYLIQMHMLAHGRLWMPGLPCPNFFDTFYVLVRPVYASMFFPGAAMMYVWVLWLHLPYEMAPLVISGICAGMLYLVVTEVLDGASGLLAALLLLSLSLFRMMSMAVMSQTPAMLLGLTMTFACLRWRRQRKAGWLVLLGAAAGWAAITRPPDALCSAIVLAVVMVMDLRGRTARIWLKTAAIVVAPAAPFFALQLVVNRNVTGHWLEPPYARYVALNLPGALGFHQGPVVDRVSDVPEKQLFYDMYIKDVLKQHQLRHGWESTLRRELKAISARTISDPFLWLIFPLAALALWDRRFWAVWGGLPLYLIVFANFPSSAISPQYVVTVMPAVIFLSVVPIRFLSDTFPNHGAMIHTMAGLGIIALCVTSMPQLDRIIHDQYFQTPELERIDAAISQNVSPPAVVLFHFNPAADDPDQEPVFNSGVVWPDDATIIRARDMNAQVSALGGPGDQNLPLYEHYHQHDPRRVFYLYNRNGGQGILTRLGTAPEMAQRTRSSASDLFYKN